MEQTMSKNAKPLLMMKALVLAYAVTGILLLLLAYLLYKMGIGRKPGEPGNYGDIHSVQPAGRLLSGEKDKGTKICLGHGGRKRVCAASYCCDLSHRASYAGRYKGNGTFILPLCHGRCPWRYAFLKEILA